MKYITQFCVILHIFGSNSAKYPLVNKIDEGSPAEAVGLRIGDRIKEIEWVNVIRKNHKE